MRACPVSLWVEKRFVRAESLARARDVLRIQYCCVRASDINLTLIDVGFCRGQRF